MQGNIRTIADIWPVARSIFASVGARGNKSHRLLFFLSHTFIILTFCKD